MCDNFQRLHERCKQTRLNILEMSNKYNNGHVAPALSMVDFLVVLFDEFITDDDKFILSKGHAALGLYCILRDKGYDPPILCHPDLNPGQGIECTTGSLGHGIGIGVGKALAKKLKNEPGNVYVVLGDGECQEGSVWEAMTIAHKTSLNNIISIVDHNKYQALDSVKSVIGENDLAKKFEAFGCHTIEVDGHDIRALFECFSNILRYDGPKTIVAHTIKGKGISFMENVPKWHNRQALGDLLERALKDLK